MYRYLVYFLATGTALIIGISSAGRALATGAGACALVTPADIAKATGLTVGKGTTSRGVPGVTGKCIWTGAGNTKVVLALGDAQFVQQLIQSAVRRFQERGGSAVAGVGTKAYGMKGPPITGGGYMIYALDSLGGFGVKIFGSEGTRDRVVSLAKLVETHRSAMLKRVGKKTR